MLPNDGFDVKGYASSQNVRAPKKSTASAAIVQYEKALASIGLHGFCQVQTASTLRKKLAWSIIVIGGLLVSFGTTKYMVKTYFENYSNTVITIKQADRLQYPTLYICPKNPDALNESLVKEDIERHVPGLDAKTIRWLVGYAIAGAGFDNMDPLLEEMGTRDLTRIKKLFDVWLDGRSFRVFFRVLFEKYGYTCGEMFHKCEYGHHKVDCCDIFNSSYVMLRGRCFKLREFYQADPDHHGRLHIVVKQLPSWLIQEDGWQPQAVMFLSAPGAETSTFPRFYFKFTSWNRLYAKLTHYKMLDSNTQCASQCIKCHQSNCYLKKWLGKRLILPFNCTLYYHRLYFTNYEVCDPELVVQNYERIIDTRTNDSLSECYSVDPFP
ncbi:Protein DEL-7 [Aphelenchoides avenae]|nr:Protein DEL-7 [Aphelenchus avenae]